MNKSLKIPTTVIKNSKGMIGLFFNRYDRLQDDNEDIRFDGENLYLGSQSIFNIDESVKSYIKSGQIVEIYEVEKN